MSGRLACLLSWLTVVAACSSQPSEPAASGGGAGEGGGGEAGLVEPQCEQGPDYRSSPDTWDTLSARAMLVRLDGEPAAAVQCQLCGVDACYAIGDAQDDGSIVLELSAPTPVDTPALKIGDGLLYAKLAHVLPGRTAEYDFLLMLAPELTDTQQPLAGARELSGEGVVITLPEGGVALVNELSFPDPEDQTLRVVNVPTHPAGVAEGAPPFASIAPAELGLEILIGLGPVETELCPPASLSVPNTPGWEPGARVEFLLHGADVAQEWAPYGGWAPVSEGQVSEDGESVVTDRAGGLPVLGVVGVRLSQE